MMPSFLNVALSIALGLCLSGIDFLTDPLPLTVSWFLQCYPFYWVFLPSGNIKLYLKYNLTIVNFPISHGGKLIIYIFLLVCLEKCLSVYPSCLV